MSLCRLTRFPLHRCLRLTSTNRFLAVRRFSGDNQKTAQDILRESSSRSTADSRAQEVLKDRHEALHPTPPAWTEEGPGKAWTGAEQHEDRHSYNREEFRKRRNMKGPLTWASLGFALAAAILGTLFFQEERDKRRAAPKPGPVVGDALIGGAFSLINDDGKPVTNEDYLGSYLVIYFGFVKCADICPRELKKMSEVVRKLDAIKGLPKVQPLFITVDPKRDTPATIKQYLKQYKIPRIVGHTGSATQLSKVAKDYCAFFQKATEEDEAIPDYQLDHSMYTYLMGPDGKFLDLASGSMVADQVVEKFLDAFEREGVVPVS